MTRTHLLDLELAGHAPLSADWQSRAACARPGSDPMPFFDTGRETPRERRLREARAKLVCGGCDVTAECLRYAVDEAIDVGIWGGLNETQRLTRVRAATLNRPA